MVDSAPLFTFRRLFGALVVFSTLRFLFYGWINCQILNPLYTFPFEEFAFLPRPNFIATIALFAGMILGGISIMSGRFFRLGAVVFFLCFTYVELLCKSNYLNHYYFVSVLSFLLIFTSSHKEDHRLPVLHLNLFRFMIGLVYFYAGVAKLNTDWLIDAQPLSIWLPQHTSMPIIGWLFQYKATAILFSWAGALFDLTAPFFLMSRFRNYFYPIVVVFHILTWLLFPIGIFPWVMIFSATIFFSAEDHRKFWDALKLSFLKLPEATKSQSPNSLMKCFVTVFILIQILFPFRYLMYSGNSFWHESGYRFGWRVMLMEKPGWARFFIKNNEGREVELDLDSWLTPNQIKMVSSQPDMIVQFAGIVHDEYLKKNGEEVKVRAEVWASLNGRRSQLLIEPFRELSSIENSWAERDYVLPFDSVISPLEYSKLEKQLRADSNW
ncbi:MAG: HTTM domain-containing protein [Crocinitomicaceae bacterium]|nr:HTTM domain-containing protein [Crocinitomicaceae bacterium]